MTREIMAILATSKPTPAQFSWLTPAQLAGLTPGQLSWLTPGQFAWLTPVQFAGLTPGQFAGLTPAQFAGLTPRQLSWLTPRQLSWLTPRQLSWLTSEQLAGLTPAQDIPSVKRLYASLLEGLARRKRILDQCIFGPEYCAEENLCKTPMCLAGHTVNLAGKPGYQLADHLGFAPAAYLIHRASRPDVAPPRYDYYPNEWARAYIEARAAEEPA